MSGGFTPSLVTKSEAVSAEASFLASEHSISKRAGATVDASSVGADANGNKILLAGTLMGKITASGKYGAYDNGAGDGRETAVGILHESINLKDGDVICGLILHGSVLEARCSGVDANGKTDLAGRIIFQ
jgi:hypothetical protein